MIKHADAGEVVETAYNEYANGKQRTALVQEFYGSEFALFKSDVSKGRLPRSLGEEPMDEGRPPGSLGEEPMEEGRFPQSLGGVLAAFPDRRVRILEHMRDSLLPLLEK